MSHKSNIIAYLNTFTYGWLNVLCAICFVSNDECNLGESHKSLLHPENNERMEAEAEAQAQDKPKN